MLEKRQNILLIDGKADQISKIMTRDPQLENYDIHTVTSLAKAKEVCMDLPFRLIIVGDEIQVSKEEQQNNLSQYSNNNYVGIVKYIKEHFLSNSIVPPPDFCVFSTGYTPFLSKGESTEVLCKMESIPYYNKPYGYQTLKDERLTLYSQNKEPLQL